MERKDKKETVKEMRSTEKEEFGKSEKRDGQWQKDGGQE